MGLMVEEIPIEDVRPNNWNPNKQSKRQYEAEIESIQKYGFIDPITVRKIEDGFEIIDGEHRFKALKDLGAGSVPAVVLDVAESQAKKLTIVLNETRGKAELVDIAKVLAQLNEPFDELQLGLPYEEYELRTILELSQNDWKEVIAKNSENKLEQVLSFHLSPEDYRYATDILKSRNKKTLEEAFMNILSEVSGGA